MSAQPSSAQDAPDPSVYDQAWRAFRDSFYDRTFRGMDWKAVGDKHRPKALRARSQRQVHEAIIDMIGELKSSHGELIEAVVSRTSGSPILDLASVDIIQRASPFDEFPGPMASEYNTVAFEYKFLFTEQLVRND